MTGDWALALAIWIPMAAVYLWPARPTEEETP